MMMMEPPLRPPSGTSIGEGGYLFHTYAHLQPISRLTPCPDCGWSVSCHIRMHRLMFTFGTTPTTHCHWTGAKLKGAASTYGGL